MKLKVTIELLRVSADSGLERSGVFEAFVIESGKRGRNLLSGRWLSEKENAKSTAVEGLRRFYKLPESAELEVTWKE